MAMRRRHIKRRRRRPAWRVSSAIGQFLLGAKWREMAPFAGGAGRDIRTPTDRTVVRRWLRPNLPGRGVHIVFGRNHGLTPGFGAMLRCTEKYIRTPTPDVISFTSGHKKSNWVHAAMPKPLPCRRSRHPAEKSRSPRGRTTGQWTPSGVALRHARGGGAERVLPRPAAALRRAAFPIGRCAPATLQGVVFRYLARRRVCGRG